MNSDDLKKRTKEYALRIIKLVKALPKTIEGRTIGNQLIRSRTADIFIEFGIVPHISKRGRDISLYQENAILKYLKIFGTSNRRIESVYIKWRDARAV